MTSLIEVFNSHLNSPCYNWVTAQHSQLKEIYLQADSKRALIGNLALDTPALITVIKQHELKDMNIPEYKALQLKELKGGQSK